MLSKIININQYFLSGGVSTPPRGRTNFCVAVNVRKYAHKGEIDYEFRCKGREKKRDRQINGLAER